MRTEEVYISRKADATFYQLQCNLSYGTITGNKALNGNGGGVAINTPLNADNPNNLPSEVVPQDVLVTIGKAEETTNKILIEDNTANSGGGIYVEAYPITYNGRTSEVYTTVRDYSEIDNNNATDNGGGLYVEKGTVTITNEATAGAASPTIKNNKATGSGGGVYLNDGNVSMTGATIGGREKIGDVVYSYGNTANADGGGLYVNTGSVTMLSTSITSNAATTGSGGGIYVGSGDVSINPNEVGTGTRSDISYNTAAADGGGIYTANGKLVAFGSYSESGSDDLRIKVTHNEAGGNGGGIYCLGNSNPNSGVYDIRLRRVNIASNAASASGGGIYLNQGKISIINGVIDGNNAATSGGGVYTHSGNIDINATRDEHHPSRITNNTAYLNGGGLNTHSGFIRVFGNDRTRRIVIKGNQATTGSGGGIFCMGSSGSTEYITLRHTDLISNRAKNGGGSAGTGVTAGCGGGMYLQQGKISITDVNIQNNYAKVNGGGINNHSGNIDVDGCYIGSSYSTIGDYYYKEGAGDGDTDRGNKADQSGGGIYTNLGDIDIEDYIENAGNLFREESKVTFNEAGANGGGINTHEGTITINGNMTDDQIEVSFNKAERGGGMYANAGTIIAYNAHIHDNTATLHGGGINNHSGDISLFGGTLSNNTAKDGHGGGAYTNVGDINIKPFNPSNKDWLSLTANDGTRIYNNIANLNGGGLNNHTGLIDLHYATLQNNTSTLGNGGGIYCEGPHASGTGFTIRLLRSTVNQNKTRGQDGTEAAPTGRGGGMYLKYGRIFAQGSTLTFNKANINGGAINNHEGNIRTYGCQISHNTATTGSGGGIYAQQGLIVVGPSGVAGASVIDHNTAGNSGGGIYNQEGNIEINGDHITYNTANNNGGGIYLALGDITMNGGSIEHNTASKKGGGVFVGGTDEDGTGFLIQKRTANTPVVEIIDVEPGSTSAVVHYHIVDDGNNSSFNSDITSGLLNQSNAQYTTSTHGTDIGDVPGCRRDTITTGLTAGNTYQVKVRVTNGNVSPSTVGESGLVSFTTLGNTPVVHTGTASNVTATSANVNGKLVFKGNADVPESGIGIEWSANKNMSDATFVSVSSSATAFTEDNYFTVTLDFGNPSSDYDTRKFYFRAKATNSATPPQTGYGELDSITLPKKTPNMGDKQVEYQFVDNGGVPSIRFSFEMPEKIHGNNYTNYGFVLSYDDDPELNTDHTINKDNIDTIGKVFRTTVPLSLFYEGAHYPSYYYYVRAFATKASNEPNAMDITNYSITDATKFVIPDPDGKPVVRLISISAITQSSAAVKAMMVMKGNSAITQYGLCWTDDASVHPTAMGGEHITVVLASNPAPGSMADSTEFTVDMPGLEKNTTYYLRVFATNKATPTAEDYVYGNEFNFTTLPVALPNAVVTSIEHIGKTSADVVCQVDNGGGSITAYGVKWGTSPTSLTQSIDHNDSQSGYVAPNGSFTENLTELNAHTTYYVQAYATNSAGTHTCQAVNFTTDYDHPSVALTGVSGLSSVSVDDNVQCNGSGQYTVRPYSNDATDNVKTYGVCWSTFHNPTRTNSDVANTHFTDHTGDPITGNAAVNCSTNMTQRFPNTRYWVRAYASTETPNDNLTDPENPVYSLADIKYSDEKAFITLPLMQTAAATQTNSTSATLGGTIASRDTEHYLIKYGVCWDANANPTPNNNPSSPNYVEVNITSANSSTRPFSFNVTGLAQNTTYHYRAYAINRNGTSGSEYDYTIATGSNIAYGPDATFTTTQYTITGTTNPTEAGWVSYGGNLTTGGGWDGSSEITVEAHANDGWQFKEWTKDGTSTQHSTANPLSETPSAADHTYQANFKARVQVAANGTGTVDITGQTGTEAYFDPNTSVTVTATPTGSATFLHWTDANGNIVTYIDENEDEVPAPASYTFTVTTPVSLTAHFSIRTVSVSANPAEGGTVTGGGTYDNGATCTVTATANSDYEFMNWTEGDNVVSTDASYQFTVSGDRTLVANFSETTGGSKNGTPTPRLQEGQQTGRRQAPRDIYPALAREPWDWDDEWVETVCIPSLQTDSTAYAPADTLVPTRATATAPATIPSINNNSAEYGGGVYVEHNANNPAKIVFAGGSTTTTPGTINENTASEAGGGIYISQGASMQMKGHCQVNSNHVPAGKKGGGIYLDGTLLVGNQASDPANAHALQVNLNWVGDGVYSEATRNNVYLPTDPILTGDALHKMRVITLLSDISGKTGTQYNSKIGLSVDRGFREVIYSEKDEHVSPGVASDKKWLKKLMPETGSLTLNSAIFEDSQKYYALHVTPSDDLFDEDYIYLWSCWTSIVAKDPNTSASPFYVADDTHYEKDDNNVWHIKTNYGLAWFSSIINGLNNQTADPTAKAVIENDLDMSAYFWVPLGSVSSSTGSGTEIAFTDGGYYQGTFNGQGHVIKGLICTYMTGIKKYGLFGTVNNNAIVKNTFVDDYRFSTYWQKSGSSLFETGYRMGGIAAETEGNAVISNCEARGTMKTPYCTANETYVGGLVGWMGAEEAGSATEVHSSMAMPEISGKAQKVGGLVGQINANNMLKNSFANMKLGAVDGNVKVGGLVGNNLGMVENCYARLQGYDPNNASTVPSNFGWFAGTNGGSISYCYAPRVANDGSNNYSSFSYVKATSGTPSLTGQDNYGLTERVSGKYGFKHRDHQMRFANNTYEQALVGKASANDTLIGGLQFTLNRWVNATNGNTSKYSTWTRTMASPINDDYPILEFADFNAVGSEDSIYMLYNTDVNTMITAFNAVDATKHPTPSIYLYKADATTTLTVSNDDNVMLAINEDIGIKQTVPLKARVGVTIKNKANANVPNWHLFSSSINGVPMGIRYRTAEDETIMNIEGYGNGTYKALIVDKAAPSGQTDPYHPESVWGNRAYFDPPTIQWYQSDNASQTATYDPNKVGYFPTNTPYGTWRSTPSTEFFDLYAYSEEFYHWVNFKREGSSTISDHWHMDRDEESNHWRLNYGYRNENGTFTLGNEPTLLNGKGYLLDLSSESMLMADGTLNTGNVSTWTTNTPVGTHYPTGNGYDAPWREINLIGNPYQSFLDFDLFAQANMPNGSGTDAWKNVFYATRDDNSTTSRNGYIYYVPTQSENKPEYTASRYIHPHQGFFVKVTGDGALTFKDNMRVAGTSTSLNSPYRDRLNYPLVNLLCYDDNGDCDLTIVEVNRPEFGGGQKMKKLHSSNGMIYARLEDRDFQVLFAPMGTNTVPVRFEAAENGYFTLRWNTLHGDFSYLHLIDNITGMDVDCLTTDEYKFEGKTTDYKSRFKLVFDCTGIDEPEDPEPDDGSTVFAFQMGNELIVNGEGMLQLFDLNGRCLMTKQAVGQQSSVSLPQVAAGMYLLRLTSNKQVRVQKMIIK